MLTVKSNPHRAAEAISKILTWKEFAQVREVFSEDTHSCDRTRKQRNAITQIKSGIEKFIAHHSTGDSLPENQQNAVDVLVVAAWLDYDHFGRTADSDKCNQHIVSGVTKFLAHYKSEQKGTLPREQQDTIDAVITASCFDVDPQLTSARQIALILCVSRSYGDVGMILSGIRHASVLENGVIVMNTLALIEIQPLLRSIILSIRTSDRVEVHPQRIWKSGETCNALYHLFLSSPQYKQFKRDNPDRAINQTVFRSLSCPCVKQEESEICHHYPLTVKMSEKLAIDNDMNSSL